ncbi:MAG TPA: sel1 repeat family protein [Gammaproteobacteria bacterium]|nr:sel1 repeat family protein [Gammaproteobacteria bacterium]
MKFYFRSHGAVLCLLGCTLLFLAPFVAFAADADTEASLDSAIKAVDEKDFSKAFTIFSRLAEAGNPEAQYNLAMLYRTGKGVAKDPVASLRWFRRAAEQGVADAQYYMGYFYDNGEGVTQDPKKAFAWYRKAAEQGHGLAQINLGVLYATGMGVRRDIEQAYLWFHVAAAQGYKRAFENRLVIETGLKAQGEQGLARLEALKQKARTYFQRYVEPFAIKPPPFRGNRQVPPGH